MVLAAVAAGVRLGTPVARRNIRWRCRGPRKRPSRLIDWERSIPVRRRPAALCEHQVGPLVALPRQRLKGDRGRHVQVTLAGEARPIGVPRVEPVPGVQPFLFRKVGGDPVAVSTAVLCRLSRIASVDARFACAHAGLHIFKMGDRPEIVERATGFMLSKDDCHRNGRGGSENGGGGTW